MEIDPKELKELYDWLFKHVIDNRAIAERIMVAEKALNKIREIGILENHSSEYNIAMFAITRIEELKKS